MTEENAMTPFQARGWDENTRLLSSQPHTMGEVWKILHDDGSDYPQFVSETGKESYLDLEYLTFIGEEVHKDEPEPPKEKVAPAPVVPSVYHRWVHGGVWRDGDWVPAEPVLVDVYAILEAYPTNNAALDHLIKKALVPGGRGHKDRTRDLRDIQWSAGRALEMQEVRDREKANLRDALVRAMKVREAQDVE